MNFLAMTLGSIGDFFPFLAIAEGLRQRGHRVVLASNAGYAGLARMAGFEFAALWERSTQSLEGLIAQNPAHAWAMVHDQMFVPAMKRSLDCIAHYTRTEQWTLLASWNVLGAAKAHDTTGLPLCKIYLSPGAVASDADHRVDGTGLRHLALYPNWFAETHITQTGFVMLDDSAIPPLPPDLEAFLQVGSPPVIFTPGSFMRDAGDFFREALAACGQLGLRAIFLTPYREQIPAGLPTYARHFTYVPLQRLASHCTALVHHGGIGTLAQGLKAGIPQLVMPLFFDQTDNAARLEMLGVSATLACKDWRCDTVAQKLRAILRSDVKKNCLHAAAHFDGNDPMERTCDAVLSAGR